MANKKDAEVVPLSTNSTTSKGWANPNHPHHRPAGGGKANGKWPEAWPGNDLAVKAGIYSSRLVEPIARQYLEQARETTPYLADPAYLPALEAWATAEAKCRLLEDYLEQHGHWDAEGQPRRQFDQLRTWQKRASEERDRLGLTPLARARLGRDVTATKVDLARLWAETPEDDDDQ